MLASVVVVAAGLALLLAVGLVVLRALAWFLAAAIVVSLVAGISIFGQKARTGRLTSATFGLGACSRSAGGLPPVRAAAVDQPTPSGHGVGLGGHHPGSGPIARTSPAIFSAVLRRVRVRRAEEASNVTERSCSSSGGSR